MGLATLTRVLLGVTFLIAGGVKTQFGKQYAPDGYKEMSKLYKRSYNVVPLREMIGMSANKFQEYSGYLDIICGALLIMGQLVNVACIFIILTMAKFTYVLYKLHYPMHMVAVPLSIVLVTLSICSSGGRKEKQD